MLTVYYRFCCCCHYLNSVCFSMVGLNIFLVVSFDFTQLPLHQQLLFFFFVSLFEKHGAHFMISTQKNSGLTRKWNRETFCFRLFRKWQWFFDYVFSCNRVFTFFLFFLFRFGFQSATCDLLFNLYLFFIAHKTRRHSIITTIIAKLFFDFGFMIIYSAEIVHNGSQLWLMNLMLKLKLKSQCFSITLSFRPFYLK